MSGGTPYIGSKISLVSKAKIRYEGYLYTIDTKESTVTLAKVQSFGTEERQTQNPVPSRDEIYEYIVFRGSDIDDLHVCEGPKSRQAPHDPAIVQTGSTQPPNMYPPMQPQMSTPFHHQGYRPFGGMPSFEYPFGFRTTQSMPVQIPPSMIGSGSQERIINTPPSTDRISNHSISPPPTAASPGAKLPPKETKSSSPPPEKPSRSERNSTSREKPRSSEVFDRSRRSEKSDRSDHYEKSDRSDRSDRYNRYEKSDRSDRYEKSNRADRYEKSNRSDGYEKSNRSDGYEKSNRSDGYEKSNRSDGYEKSNRSDGYEKSNRSDGYEKSNRSDAYEKSDRSDGYEKSDRSRPRKKTRPTSQERQRRGSASGPRGRGRGRGGPRGGSRGSGRRSPYNHTLNHRNKQSFDEEFDFESANAKFNKEEIEKELLKTLKKSLSIKDDDDVIVENDTSKVSLDGNEENEDEDGLISPDKYYDFSKSFFDSISCESFERGGQVTSENNTGDSPFNRSSGRITRRQERALNIETFGYPQHGYRGRGRGRGRPFRGRGGRGRGPSRGFRGRGNLSGSNRAWVDYEFDYEAAGINQKTGLSGTASVGGS